MLLQYPNVIRNKSTTLYVNIEMHSSRLNNNLKLKNGIRTIFYYSFAFLIVFISMRFFRSGPRAPNLDILVWPLAMLVSLTLCIRSLYLTIIKKDNSLLYSAILHIILCPTLVSIGFL